MSYYQQGISYVEVLIATAILAVALVPAIDALRTGIRHADLPSQTQQTVLALNNKLESVLAQSSIALRDAAAQTNSRTVATSYSDPAGTDPRVLVYLSFYDVGNTDGDNTLLTLKDLNNDGDSNPFTGDGAEISAYWVRVQADGTELALEALRAP